MQNTKLEFNSAALSALNALYESVLDYKKTEGNDVKDYKDSETAKEAYEKFHSEFSLKEPVMEHVDENGVVVSESVEEKAPLDEKGIEKINALVDAMISVSDIAESVTFEDFLNSIQGNIAVKRYMAEEVKPEEVLDETIENIEEEVSPVVDVNMLSEDESKAFEALFDSIVDFLSESEDEEEKEDDEDEEEEEEKKDDEPEEDKSDEEEKSDDVEKEDGESEEEKSDDEVDEAIDISKIKIGKLVRSGRKNRKMSKAIKMAKKRPHRKMTPMARKRARLYQAARRKKLKILGLKKEDQFNDLAAIIPFDDTETIESVCEKLNLACECEDGECCLIGKKEDIEGALEELKIEGTFEDFAYEFDEEPIEESLFSLFANSKEGLQALKEWSNRINASSFKIADCIEPKLNKLASIHIKAFEDHINESLKKSPVVTMGILNESQTDEIKLLVSESVKEMSDISITALKEDMINTCEAYLNEEVIPSILDTFDKTYIPMIKDSLTEEVNEYVTYVAKAIASELAGKNLVLKSRKTLQLEEFETDLIKLIKDKLSIIPEQEDELNKLETRNKELRESLQNVNIEKVKMENKVLELSMENYIISNMPESLSESYKEKLLGYADEVLMESCKDMESFKEEFDKACKDAVEAEEEEKKASEEDSMDKFKKEEDEKECDCKDGEACDKCKKDEAEEEEIEESEEELKQKFVEIANKLKKIKKEMAAEEDKEDAVNEEDDIMNRIMRAGGK